MTARAPAPARPGLTSLPSEPVVTQAQLQNFDDYKRRHSKQNRDIIRENANRLIINRNLQEEVGKLHVKILEEKAEKVALAEELRRTKEELERIKSESSKDALDAILAAVPALKQLRHKLGSRKSTIAASSSASFNSHTLSSRAVEEAQSKRYPEVNTWEGRPDVVAAGRPGLDDVVEATERGSESDWSCHDGVLPVERVRRLPHQTPTKTSDPPECTAFSLEPASCNALSPITSASSPTKPIVRPRGRRESAMFKRSEKSPSPEVNSGLAHPPQPDLGRPSHETPSTPPRVRYPPPNALPNSPLRRSPRKAIPKSFAGDDILTSPPSVVDTGIVIPILEHGRRRSLVERRRSVAIPISYAEEEEEDQVVRDHAEAEREQESQVEREAKRGEKRRRDKVVSDTVSREVEIVGHMRMAGEVPDATRALSPRTHEEVLIQMARSRHPLVDTQPSSSSSASSSSSSSRRVAALLDEPASIPAEPAQTVESDENGGGGSRTARRSRASVSYKEPSLNTKMRKPDGAASETPAANRKAQSNFVADGALPVPHDRSRSTTPGMFTPAKSGRELAILATPSALPSDTMDEEIVESLAGSNRVHTLELDARSSNVRRKSVLPTSRRDENIGLAARPKFNASGIGSSGYALGATKGMTRTTSSASAKLSDAARACDLPSSPDENGSGRSLGTAPVAFRSASTQGSGAAPPGIRTRTPLSGLTKDIPSGVKARSDHPPSPPVRGPIGKPSGLDYAAALSTEEGGTVVARRAQRRQSGVVRA